MKTMLFRVYKNDAGAPSLIYQVPAQVKSDSDLFDKLPELSEAVGEELRFSEFHRTADGWSTFRREAGQPLKNRGAQRGLGQRHPAIRV